MAGRCIICKAWIKSTAANHNCPGASVTVVPQLATNKREGSGGGSDRESDAGSGGREEGRLMWR